MDEEIRGFQSPMEYQKFVKFVEERVKDGSLLEIPADVTYEKRGVFGGRWFKKSGSGKVWRLVPPDFPFRGIWEVVE